MKTRATKLDTIQPHPDNVNEGDIGAICESLEFHGQYRAIVVSEATGNILAGNHTYLAAQQLGWSSMLAHWLPDLTAEQEMRIMLADNAYARKATTDSISLSEILSGLAVSPDALLGTGYDGDDLDQLLADLTGISEEEELAEIPQIPENPVTQLGDVWNLDGHRLVCGDASDPKVWEQLMDGYAPIQVAVTSPPYADRRDYDKTSGFTPIPPDEYVEWFAPFSQRVADNLAEDGSWFVNIKPGVAPGGLDTETYVLDLVLAHVREWGWHYATEFCWERNGVPKSVTQRFKNQFEPVYQFTRNRWKMRPDNVRHHSDNALTPFGAGIGDTGWDGRGDIPGQGGTGSALPHHAKNKRRNKEWETVGAGEYIGPGLAYPGNRLPTFAGTHTALGHAAAYPIGLPQFFIEAYTDEGDTTVDPFAGTGSTLMAAHNTNRIGLAIEISPAYCDVIVKRWETATGGTGTKQ